MFYFCWLWCFCPSKNVVFYLHQEKALCYAQFKLLSFFFFLYVNQINKFLWIKYSNDKKENFHKRSKKIKHLAEKSLSVFRGLTCETSEYTKTFFRNMFYYFCRMFMKITFAIISRFFAQPFTDFVKIFFKKLNAV